MDRQTDRQTELQLARCISAGGDGRLGALSLSSPNFRRQAKCLWKPHTKNKNQIPKLTTSVTYLHLAPTSLHPPLPSMNFPHDQTLKPKPVDALFLSG